VCHKVGVVTSAAPPSASKIMTLKSIKYTDALSNRSNKCCDHRLIGAHLGERVEQSNLENASPCFSFFFPIPRPLLNLYYYNNNNKKELKEINSSR